MLFVVEYFFYYSFKYVFCAIKYSFIAAIQIISNIVLNNQDISKFNMQDFCQFITRCLESDFRTLIILESLNCKIVILNRNICTIKESSKDNRIEFRVSLKHKIL